jgi:hypothetical protein
MRHHVSNLLPSDVGLPFDLSDDVASWVKLVFAGCNDHVTAKLSNMPHTYETALDMALIEHLSSVPAPVTTSSGWTVNIATHFLGGGRHFAEQPGQRRWEIADIGVLILFRRGGTLLRSKVALLQSKRLYAAEIDWDEDNPLDYIIGFRRLLEDDTDWGVIANPRRFTFTDESRYKALRKDDHQYQAIAGYQPSTGVPVYYLLYNPAQLPSTRELPTQPGNIAATPNDVGCRVIPATELQNALVALDNLVTPQFRDLPPASALPLLPGDDLPGWRLEEFIADLIIQCKAGYVAASRHDAGLDYVFNRRGAPIAAAFQITIDAPAGTESS